MEIETANAKYYVIGDFKLLAELVLCLPSSGWKQTLMKTIDFIDGAGSKGSWMAPKENWKRFNFWFDYIF